MSGNKANHEVMRGRLLLMLAVALAGCGGGGESAFHPDTTAPPAATAPVIQVSNGTWVVMGASTAAGTGAPAGKGWVDQLQAATTSRGLQFANIAVGGSVTYHGMSIAVPTTAGRPAPNPAANIDQALSRKPVALIISYPTNDTALGYSTDETVHNILDIRSRALATGVPVLITSTQPRNLSADKLAQMKDIDRRLAANVGACFVDVGKALAAADGHLAAEYDAGDGVHPNEAGHRLIAAKIQQALDGGECVRLPSGT